MQYNKEGNGGLGFFTSKSPISPTNIKYSFRNMTELLISGNLHFMVVTGHNTATGGKEQNVPIEEAKHIRGGNFCDLLYIPHLVCKLTMQLCKTTKGACGLRDVEVKLVPDIYLELKDAVDHNLVLLGAGNVNWVVEHIFKQYWNNAELLPIHFRTTDTHEIIVSEISGKEYAAERYPEPIDYAIMEMVPNPWNEKKFIVLCCGTDMWGTQAAVYSLCKENLGNNAINSKYPAKVLSVKLNSRELQGFRGHRVPNFFSFHPAAIVFEE